jgi:1-acyl-sn-glycerol-3-phosphate acyltransferase
MGWTAIEPVVPENKCIILGVPHTSAWDFVISYLYYKSVGGQPYCVIKKEFFWGPLGPIVRWMGGVPVDRSRGATAAKQMIDAMNKAEYMHLAIAPEGTRKRTDNWKTGFHTIARACNVPVYLGYFDWKTKTIGRGELFELTDDAKADMKRIRQHYKDKGYGAKYPELYSTGKGLE